MIAKYRNQAYYIIVGNLHQDGVGLLPTKFDTGAAGTIFSTQVVFPDAPNYVVQKLSAHVIANPSKYHAHTFGSASGGEMLCIKTYRENVVVDGSSFDKFYYWLYLNHEISKALIGDDFIRFCTFSHAPLGDIVITSFDKRGYADFHMNCGEQNAVSEISEVDIASIMRGMAKIEDRVVKYDTAYSNKRKKHIYYVEIDNHRVPFTKMDTERRRDDTILFWHNRIPYKLILGVSSNLNEEQRKFLFER